MPSVDETQGIMDRWRASGQTDCKHPAIEKEVSAEKTGDYICLTCGDYFNRLKPHPKLP